MVFASIEFLFVFLPVALIAVLVAPRPARNTVLLLASLLFYVWGGGRLVSILLVSVGCNWVLGLAVARLRRRKGPRRLCVAASVAVNLTILGWYKYANFAADQWQTLRDALGWPTPDGVEWAAVALPIGISFYTFQSMSYVFDVARGLSRPLRNPVDFGLYVSMFPQLIAGPVVRFREIEDRIRKRRVELRDLSEGALRFSVGLVKKVVVADSVAVLADAVFGLPHAELSGGAAWLGLIAYTLQIYFDFSGYTDMALGLGRMLGFRLPENFDRPYSALSITDFWRRWHITLSSWFRDYLYIPLGGSRVSRARTAFNLATVFLLVGAWHGASWNFIAWGGYHGVLLFAERLAGQRVLAPRGALDTVSRRAVTLLLVMCGWVLFRADDLIHAKHYYTALLGGFSEGLPVEVALAATTRNVAVLIAAAGVFLLPRDWSASRSVETGTGPWVEGGRLALLGFGVPYAALLLFSGSYSPFLYFQF